MAAGLLACDPLRRLQMENTSGNNAVVEWQLKENDSLFRHPLMISNSKDVHFRLGTNRPYNYVNMSFGTGNWSPDYLQNFLKGVEALKINKGNGETILKEDSLYDYLLARRRGIGGRKLYILID